MGDTNTTGPNAFPDLESLKEAVSVRQQINSLERRLSGLFVGGGSSTSGSRSGRRRRMSAATRAKLATAAKSRWARQKEGARSAAAKEPARKKGGLSAAGRKKLSDAMKARWAARRKKMRRGVRP